VQIPHDPAPGTFRRRASSPGAPTPGGPGRKTPHRPRRRGRDLQATPADPGVRRHRRGCTRNVPHGRRCRRLAAVRCARRWRAPRGTARALATLQLPWPCAGFENRCSAGGRDISTVASSNVARSDQADRWSRASASSSSNPLAGPWATFASYRYECIESRGAVQAAAYTLRTRHRIQQRPFAPDPRRARTARHELTHVVQQSSGAGELARAPVGRSARQAHGLASDDPRSEKRTGLEGDVDAAATSGRPRPAR